MSSLLAQRARSENESSDASSDHENDHEAEALAVAVAAAFLLTDAEVAQISAAILTARLAAWKATYAAAAKTAGATLPDGGATPSAAEERKQQRESDAAAASIAATYARDLASHAATFTQDWLRDHDGSLDGAEDALRDDLAAYSETRADGKGAQVAQYESGVGGNDGTHAAMDDLASGDLPVYDDEGQLLSDLLSILYVAILPDDSSPDFCFDYAGNIYAFDDAPAIDFPAHIGCIHAAYLLTAAEVGDDQASM